MVAVSNNKINIPKKKGHLIKIGLIQNSVSNDIDKNLALTEKLIGKAASKGAEIICLQELFALTYIGQEENKKWFSLAEQIPGKTSNFLQEVAKKHKVNLVGGSIFENDKGKYYNTALVINKKGEILGKYRKVHIPHDEHYYEQFYFSGGDKFVQTEIEGVKIAPLICYDQWFPEAARINVLNGAQILFYPTAIGWFDVLKKNEPWSKKRWQQAMASHASLNGIYTVGVNRVGKEGVLTFWGGSCIADPFGEIIAEASENEEVLVVEIDLEKNNQSQEGWLFLKNRKPSSYKDLIR
ncbi:MAG: nitrilase-related carbon-nitrogen hydrolase [Candidatus Woesearchaeota archaeon]